MHLEEGWICLLRVPPVKISRPEITPSPKEFLWPKLLTRKFLGYGLLGLTSLLALAPLWQITVFALEPANSIGIKGWRWPAAAHFDNFFLLLTTTGFIRWVANSFLVALAVTAVGLILSTTAGYAISRFRFFGRVAVLSGLLLTQIFPATMLLLPIFLILVQWQLINTFFGLGIIYLATVLPFNIWQMKSFYDSVPENLEEIAAMDGCSPSQIFRLVILPISAPGLAVTALFTFAAVWNEYVVASILLQDIDRLTLPLGLNLLHGEGAAGQPGLFAAGALLVTIPMLVLYLLLSRFLLERVRDITIRH